MLCLSPSVARARAHSLSRSLSRSFSTSVKELLQEVSAEESVIIRNTGRSGFSAALRRIASNRCDLTCHPPFCDGDDSALFDGWERRGGAVEMGGGRP
mmetsp:Transcript_93908/g.137128  ORF Transcript_93908/g.137128 Transcript_93908/m.137128 type:complete len:98 (-) Transcript_93908:289-582(-)